MSASTEDVNLIIVYQGVTRCWSGMKGCGNVFLDTRFGLYSDDPKPDLHWIQGTPWEEMLIALNSPLDAPIYGDLIIDFDRRLITDGTNFGSPFELIPQWLCTTWEMPEEAAISVQSLKEHLAQQRVRVLSIDDMRNKSAGVLLSADYDEAVEQFEQMIRVANPAPMKIAFDQPAGWLINDALPVS